MEEGGRQILVSERERNNSDQLKGDIRPAVLIKERDKLNVSVVAASIKRRYNCQQGFTIALPASITDGQIRLKFCDSFGTKQRQFSENSLAWSTNGFSKRISQSVGKKLSTKKQRWFGR